MNYRLKLTNYFRKIKRLLKKSIDIFAYSRRELKPNPYLQEQDIRYQEAKDELLKSGLFKKIWSLQGWAPIQGEGILANGQLFYFRADEDYASLSIADTFEEMPDEATREEVVTPGENYAASYLPAERTKEIILKWVGEYLDSKA